MGFLRRPRRASRKNIKSRKKENIIMEKTAAPAETMAQTAESDAQGAADYVRADAESVFDYFRQITAIPHGSHHTKEISGAYEKTTNNRMELLAAIVGLEALNRPCEVELYSDSKYLVDAFNAGWVDSWIKKGWKRAGGEPVKNISLWKRLLAAKEPHQVNFIWVKGHAGHPQNERCDELATKAADEGPWLTDDLGL